MSGVRHFSTSRSLIVWLNEAEHLKLMFRADGAEDFGSSYRSFVRAVGKVCSAQLES